MPFSDQIRDDAILRFEGNLIIPFDPANTDYQAYLRWIEDGNTPQPPDAPQSGAQADAVSIQ